MKKKYKVAIIGGGNGGQSLAGHFGMLGHDVCLYNRTYSRIAPIAKLGGILLKEAISGFGRVRLVTDSLEEALSEVELIMIATTADSHADIAKKMTPFLKDGQIIVLNPGRTCGAIEVAHVFKQIKMTKQVFLAEAQSLIYACRADTPGEVRIIGVKDKVLLSALPSIHTNRIVKMLNSIYDCFYPVDHVLVTSLENIGAIFHPAVVIFNAASIERGQDFLFYNDMTAQIANFLQKIDAERLSIGKAFGLKLVSATDWISLAYKNISGTTLCEKIRNNPAYYRIQAPRRLDSRLLMEDIPTGILPMLELARLVKVQVPLLNSVFEIAQALLNQDFINHGRTLLNLGLSGKTKSELIEML